MRLETLSDLYLEQLRDLYSAETQIIAALPTFGPRRSAPLLNNSKIRERPQPSRVCASSTETARAGAV